MMEETVKRICRNANIDWAYNYIEAIWKCYVCIAGCTDNTRSFSYPRVVERDGESEGRRKWHLKHRQVQIGAQVFDISHGF